MLTYIVCVQESLDWVSCAVHSLRMRWHLPMAGSCTHLLDVVKMYARYRSSAFPFRLKLFRRMQTSKPLSIFITLNHICYSLLPHPVWLRKFISRPQCIIHATNDLLLSHNGKPSTTLQLIFAAGLAGALGGILGNSSGIFVCGRLNTDLMPNHSCPTLSASQANSIITRTLLKRFQVWKYLRSRKRDWSKYGRCRWCAGRGCPHECERVDCKRYLQPITFEVSQVGSQVHRCTTLLNHCYSYD